jgi:hypothetical protein
MKKLSISKVIEYSRTSEKGRSKFIKKHNEPKPPSSGGGDYWVSCISALRHAFSNDDNSIITEKIEYLLGEIKKTPHQITKNRYQRNIHILYNFEEYNFSKWIPIDQIKILKKNSSYSVIKVEGVPIQVKPTHVFTFKNDGIEQIGAIVFVSKLGGYKRSELAAFTDSLYRYLKVNYSDKFKINASLCIAVDSSNLKEITYEDIQNGDVRSILEDIIYDIKKVA